MWWWPWPNSAGDRPGPDRPAVCRRRGKVWSGFRRRSSGSWTASGRRRPRSGSRARRPCSRSRSCTGSCSATTRCPFPLSRPTRWTTRPTLCTWRPRPACCPCSPTRLRSRPLLQKNKTKNKISHFSLSNFVQFSTLLSKTGTANLRLIIYRMGTIKQNMTIILHKVCAYVDYYYCFVDARQQLLEYTIRNTVRL